MISDALRQLVGRRYLLATLISREVRGRYIDSVGGLLWILLQPIMMLAIYTVVFRTIFRVEIPGLNQNGFVAFVALGLWPWLAFQETVQRGAQTILANAQLIKKVTFPHEYLVIASATATFAIHLSGYLLVLAILALTGIEFHWGMLPSLLVILGTLYILALSLALFVASLTVFIRDIEQAIGPLMMVWFYATPVLYPIEMLPPWLKLAMSFNPIAGLIDPIRMGLLHGAPVLHEVWPSSLLSVLFLFSSWLIFRRLSPHFEDFL